MTRIVICSTNAIETAGLLSILRQHPDSFETTVSPDPDGLAAQIKADSCRVAMVDIANDISLEMLKTLRVTCPEVAIILRVGNVPTELISQALRLGILGILPKSASVESHLECIQQVSEGELWVESGLSKRLLGLRSVALTRRERQLTELLSHGLKNKEIGYRLGISEGTVKVYLSRLYAKLGVGDRFDLALLTLKNLGGERATGSDSVGVMSASKGPFLMPASISIGQASTHIQ